MQLEILGRNGQCKWVLGILFMCKLRGHGGGSVNIESPAISMIDDGDENGVGGPNNWREFFLIEI